MLFRKKEQQNTQQHFDSTQKYLEIDSIKDDIVNMKDGSIRAVLMVSGLNMELRSGDEQGMIISVYQSMLNSLEFPIQILVQSRRVDLTSYLSTLESSANQQTIPLLKDQTYEYIVFLKNILSSVNVMDKRFFVVVPFYPSVVTQGSEGILSFLGIKKKSTGAGVVATNNNLNIQSLKKRVDITVSLLSDVNLTGTALPTEALIELFYACYNPETAGHEHIKNLSSLGAKYISTREAVEKNINQ
jgi:hypothetical protein